MIDPMSQEQLDQKYRSTWEEHRRTLRKPNILVAGGTGVGKSSLVNQVFENNIAQVGAGKPVTQGIKRLEHEYVVLYDTEGYENGAESQERFHSVILGRLDDVQRIGSEAIHLVWYCISQPGHRLLDVDIKTVNETARRIPICVVLTQADAVEEEESAELRRTVEQHCPGISIFEASTDRNVVSSADSLIQWSCENLDAGAHSAFLAGVRGGIPMKEKEGARIVLEHSGTAAAIAASPIPMSDAPLLIANQLAMVARLATLWNMEAIKTTAIGGVASQAVAIAGRSLAGNLLKLIPGFGTVAGAAINATVASAVTAAAGYTVNDICARIRRDELSGTVKDIASYFNSEIVKELISSYLTGTKRANTA